MTLPPLDLSVNITSASGVTYRWGSEDDLAANRPQNISFNTKRGDGFGNASVTLPRRIDLDYVDIGLFDDVVLVGADGSVAYEGRITAEPRSFSETHSIGVECAGWMSHARDRPAAEVYVDRDINAWGESSKARQGNLLTNNYSLHSFAARPDSAGSPALSMDISGAWVSPYLPRCDAVYDCGVLCQAVNVYLGLAGQAGLDAGFAFTVEAGPDDLNLDVSTADLWSGSNTSGYYNAGYRRFIVLSLLYSTTPAGADGGMFTLQLLTPAVYGDHGITLIGDTDPQGVAASEVIKHIAGKYCPKLNIDGVMDTTWAIPHLVFKNPIDPYDIFLAVNAYHLWELAVWENKTLTYAPSNREDYDWDVRLDDFGTKIELQGDSTEDLANGILVSYTDVTTGAKHILVPTSYDDLTDTSLSNPATLHGLTKWTKIELTSPTTTDAAVQIGRMALAEFNAPKAPGTITVVGHVRDRAGHWQQGWKVRAGQTLAITNHPNSAPRLITETSWNHDSKEVTITVDGTSKRLDAVLDRVGSALTAAGLK